MGGGGGGERGGAVKRNVLNDEAHISKIYLCEGGIKRFTYTYTPSHECHRFIFCYKIISVCPFVSPAVLKTIILYNMPTMCRLFCLGRMKRVPIFNPLRGCIWGSTLFYYLVPVEKRSYCEPLVWFESWRRHCFLFFGRRALTLVQHLRGEHPSGESTTTGESTLQGRAP